MDQKNKKEKLRRYCGNMQQEAYIRPIAYQDGRADGLKAYQVKNGPMQFTCMQSKCLDISEFTYEGMNYCFLSKPGLQGRNQYDTNGAEAQRSIMGGLFFTAGLENAGAPVTVDGINYPMHGRMRTTPAELCGASCEWKDGKYVLSVTGTMREGELFGEHLTLKRRIETVYGAPYFDIYDTVENLGFRDEILMMLYHFNMGYPLLDEHALLILPDAHVEPIDEHAAAHMEDWDQMEEPIDNEPERCYAHELEADELGDTCALFYNPSIKKGLCLEYSIYDFPNFVEWKSMAAGDYVCGMEPATFARFKRNPDQAVIHPGETVEKHIRVRVIRNEEEAKAVIGKSLSLMGMDY